MTMKYTPQDIDDLTLAFPAKVSDLMPTYDDIPEDFKGGSMHNPWVKLQMKWFYEGLKGYSFVPKDGIDPDKALRHLSAIQGSFEPKHQHKEAAVAYLLSLWFEEAIPPKGK